MHTDSQHETSAPLLRVQDLKIAYGGIQAVKGVSLEVREGELVSLIGANGAGKTTTLNAIAGAGRRRTGSSTPPRQGGRCPRNRAVRKRAGW